MRSFFFFLMVSLFTCNFALSAAAAEGVRLDSSSFDVGLGYRSDQLSWNIAGDTAGGGPDILSELEWDDLDIVQLEFSGQLELADFPWFDQRVMVQGDLAIGKIWGGTAEDTDYAGRHRSNVIIHSVSDADAGMTFDFSAAVGPVLEFDVVPKLKVIPLIGYGFNMQGLTMTGGELLPVRSAAAAIPIAGLDSSYTAYWYGPWLGVSADYRIDENIVVSTGLEYHWISYFAQADWNLRTDFEHPVSFEHDAHGSGVVWNLDGSYRLDRRWTCLVQMTVQDWEATDGTDRTFLSDGSVAKSRLNQVDWRSFAITAGLSYQF